VTEVEVKRTLTCLIMSTEKTQRLVQSIIEFLEEAIADGTVKSDDKEGLEVASKDVSLFLQATASNHLVF
jgi:DNA-binding ferritin-like protein (Dps family)